MLPVSRVAAPRCAGESETMDKAGFGADYSVERQSNCVTKCVLTKEEEDEPKAARPRELHRRALRPLSLVLVLSQSNRRWASLEP